VKYYPIIVKFGTLTQTVITNKKAMLSQGNRATAVNSDRYQLPVGQKQSEWETENIT